MRCSDIRHVPALMLAAATASLLSACGNRSESEMLDAARARLQRNEQVAAIIELKSTLQTYPQSAQARVLLGDTLLNTGAAQQAAIELEKARELKAGDAVVVPLLARALLASGQAKKVVQQFERTTLPDPRADAQLRTALALAYGALGESAKSEALIDSTLKQDSAIAAARLEKARLLGLRGATDEALALLSSLSADEPKNSGAYQLRGDLLLGAKGDVEGAAKAYHAALAADDRFTQAHIALISLAQRKGDVEAMKTQVAALRKVAPNSLPARFFAAQIALGEGRLTEARDDAQQLLRVAPTNPQFLHLAGTVELRRGALTVAESHLNKAVQQAPDAPAPRRSLAQAYLQLGQGSKALPILAPLTKEAARPDAEALTLTAQAHLQAGEKASADLYFARALKADPNDAKLRSAVALSEISKGDLDAGFKQLESVAARDKGVAADLALIGARLRRNELDSALNAVEKLQSKLPDKPLPHYLRGRIALNKGDQATARSNFERAISIDPGYYAVAASLASMDVADQQPDRALKRFQDVLARDPRNPRAVLAVVDLRQRAGAKPDELQGLLDDAIKRSPSEATLRLALIAHHVKQNDLKAALKAAQDAAAALPNDVRVLDALGEMQLRSGNAQQAVASFSKAAAAQPKSTTALLRLADAYGRSNDRAAATRTLQRALSLAPDLLPAQQGLVRFALDDKRYDDAIGVARNVQKQRPASPMGFLLESEVRARQQQWDGAIAAGKSALERGKTSSLAARLQVLYVMAGRKADAEHLVDEWERTHPNDADFQLEIATLALGVKNFAEAEMRFRKVLTLRPDDASTLNNLAWVLTQQRKPGAVALAERAHTLRPESVALIDTLASAHAAENRLGEAISWQRKAVAAAPQAAAYRFKLAKWLASSGDKAAARAELETLVKLGDKFPEQAQVAALLKTL